MLQWLVLFVIIFVIMMSILKYKKNQWTEVDYVTSDYDQHSYLVRNLPDKQNAAMLLSMIRDRLIRLVNYLHNHYPNNSGIKRLVEKFDPDKLTESSDSSLYTSYSINKGEKIVFCLRQRDEEEQLLDLNTMMFVAIHELAHIMTKSVGHTEEFWNNMKFLLKQAMNDQNKLYTYQPYHLQPQLYCGTVISDTPIKQ